MSCLSSVIYLIPHYNNPEGLLKSLMSLGDSEVLVVDDGSDSRSDVENVLDRFDRKLVRIQYLERNMGIEAALNAGVNRINHEGYSFIARLDCGDTSVAGRLERQLDEFAKDSDVVLVGAWAKCVDEAGVFLRNMQPPVLHEDIRRSMFMNSAFIHPSVMFKTSSLVSAGLYPTSYPAAEDYALFFNMMKIGRVMNVPKELIVYEISANSISSTRRHKQIMSRIRVLLENFELSVYPVFGLFRAIAALFFGRKFGATLRGMFGR